MRSIDPVLRSPSPASALLALPDAPLCSGQPLGDLLLARGVRSFRAAAAFVHELPYGRVSRPDAYTLVVSEGRGTCSSKHALLAALAREQGVEIQLMIGLFEMDEANTPGVGGVLRQYGLSAIPEAHCYLVAEGERIDVTHPGSSARCSLHILEEVEIEPPQAGAYKGTWHRERLACWAAERDFDVGILWHARERCILALSAKRPVEEGPA